jgi:spermidine/putrescine-binding protein
MPSPQSGGPSHSPSRLLLVGALAASALAVSACGAGGGQQTAVGSGKPSGTLRIVAETEVLAPAMLKPFEQANPGVKIESALVEGSNEAATKLSAGFSADIVETCADESNILLKRGLLQPIDTSRLTHWSELSPHLRAAEGVVVDGKQMFLPGQAGPMGMVYNTKDFPDGVDTIKELFNPKLKGKVAFDVGGDDKSMIAMTAFSLGVKNPFRMSEAELNSVGKYLLAHVDQFRTFPDSDANELNLMKSGEVILTDEDPGAVHEMIEAGVPVKWVAPKEGYYSWTCGLALTKSAKNLNAAYAFLNYYISARAQAVFGDEGYTILNQNALPDVKANFRHTADPTSLAGATIEQAPNDPERWYEIYQQVVGE